MYLYKIIYIYMYIYIYHMVYIYIYMIIFLDVDGTIFWRSSGQAELKERCGGWKQKLQGFRGCARWRRTSAWGHQWLNHEASQESPTNHGISWPITNQELECFFRSETIRSPATIPILPGLEGISIPEYTAGLPACPLAALAEKEVPSPLRNEALASRWKTGGDQRWEVDQNSKNIWNPLRAD